MPKHPVTIYVSFHIEMENESWGFLGIKWERCDSTVLAEAGHLSEYFQSLLYCFVLLIDRLQNPCVRNCSILAVHFLILISSCHPALLIHYYFMRILPLAPSVAREYYWPMISINTLSFKFVRGTRVSQHTFYIISQLWFFYLLSLHLSWLPSALLPFQLTFPSPPSNVVVLFPSFMRHCLRVISNK